ncbi:S1 family peptidase [Acuticoccus yangtzensis]|uniref:S1 family peptidase n=1 Tax=Acuticoccus yangtzensis TaxID=1443441 RepID=UPI0009495C68|nr:serine protease [Acuticoccus yangtzensis]
MRTMNLNPISRTAQRRLGRMIVILAAWLSVGPVDAAPSADVVNAAKRSVGRIEASGCSGDTPARIGTGFVWLDGKTVLTARHVVAGCNRIKVRFEALNRSFDAQPLRQLAEQDLISLQLPVQTGLPPLPVQESVPSTDDILAAIGYALGAPTLDDKHLRVTSANDRDGARLRDLLNDSARRELARSGELDPDTRIIRLDGNLLPGHSGGPLIDSRGSVRAIGSGGLRSGAGGVVWAVLARYAKDLATAPIVTHPLAHQATSLAFAYQTELPDSRNARVECGDAVLTPAGRFTLADGGLLTDDVAGLQQILMMWQIGPDELGTYAFQRYVDQESGASVAIPVRAGALRSSGDTCVADGMDPLTFVIQGRQLDQAASFQRTLDVQQKSAEFEGAINSRLPNRPFMIDPSLTYGAPQNRWDGFVVRRKGYANQRPTFSGDPEADVVFLTHMARGDQYFGVAAIMLDLEVPYAAAQSCHFAPLSAQCRSVKDRMAPRLSSIVAVHLATYPPL